MAFLDLACKNRKLKSKFRKYRSMMLNLAHERAKFTGKYVIIYGMLIRENVPIAGLTTMRLGGNARYVVEVETPEDVPEAYRFAEEKNLPVWVMGGGANTIGRDEGYPGVVILNRIRGIFTEIDEEEIEIEEINAELFGEEELTVRAMGGEVWDDLVQEVCALGYSGVEALSLIPGTVGAAPVQNIGAYGQELSQSVEAVEVFDTKTKEFTTLEKSEMGLGYRKSRFNSGEDVGRFFVVAVALKLKRKQLEPPFYNSLQRYLDGHDIHDYSPRSIRQAVCTIRNEKLPDPEKQASAGSFFKNIFLDKQGVTEAEAKGVPIWKDTGGSGKINAGWLIEACGLKGKELYGFRVSEKASLVLINESAKSYADLAKARAEIVATVKQKYGYTLEQEPVEMPIE